MIFQFRLQTLLDVRIAERNEKRRQLEEALQAVDLLRQQAVELEHQTNDAQQSARLAGQAGQVNTDALLAASRHRLTLASQRALLEESKAKIVEEAESRRKSLIEADRQVRMLEKLRDRQFAEHQLLEKRKETKELDEVGARSWRESR